MFKVKLSRNHRLADPPQCFGLGAAKQPLPVRNCSSDSSTPPQNDLARRQFQLPQSALALALDTNLPTTDGFRSTPDSLVFAGRNGTGTSAFHGPAQSHVDPRQNAIRPSQHRPCCQSERIYCLSGPGLPRDGAAKNDMKTACPIQRHT